MKKIVSIILIITMLALSLVACTDKKGENDQNGVVLENTKFLVGEWERADQGYGDTMYLNLGADASFAFYCACGNPVGNADCYDTFEYREDEGVIRAFDSGDRECYQDYKLYMHGKNFIIIDVDGEIMEFWAKGTHSEPPTLPAEQATLADGFTMYRTMTDVSDTEITLTPPYYDGDVKEHRKEKVKFKLAEDLVIEDLEIHTVYKDGEETTTVKHEVKDMEYLALVLDSTLGGGFVWLNDDLEVCKIMLYGAIYNWE